MDNQSTTGHDSENANTASPPTDVTKTNDPKTAELASAQQLTEVEKQMSGFEKSTLRWARVAVLMSFLAALFVCAQWYEMHTSGADTHNLALAAKEQATLMRKQLKSLQGALLQFEFAGLKSDGFHVNVSNAHEFAATDVTIKVTVTEYSLQQGPFGQSIVQQFSPHSIVRETPFPIDVPIPWPYELKYTGNEPWPSDKTVQIKVEYTYNDGIDDAVPGSFCYVWLPVIAIVTKTENASFGSSLPCDGLPSTIQHIRDRIDQIKKGDDQKAN